jgi:hypothetical protein
MEENFEYRDDNDVETGEDNATSIDRTWLTENKKQQFVVKESGTREVDDKEKMEKADEKREYLDFVKTLIPAIQSKEYVDRIKRHYGGNEKAAENRQKYLLETINTYLQESSGEIDKNFISEINKDTEVEIEQYDNEKVRDEYAEYAREKIIEFVSSSDYLKKLTIEFGGDEEKARLKQNRRVELLRNVIVDSSDDAVIDNIGGDYNYFFNYINVYNRVKGEEFKESMKHELLHASTRANWNIPENTKQKLTDSFEAGMFMKKTKELAYFSMPTERLVRKQLLDRDLEKYGVKKYGEEFTEEHYKKMMILKQLDLLGNGANQFIETTKSDFDTYKTLFDEIADNSILEDNKELFA